MLLLGNPVTWVGSDYRVSDNRERVSQGQPFCGPELRVLLLGNPVTWWGSLVALGLYALLTLYHSARVKKGRPDSKLDMGTSRAR